jgi:cobalt-zinc-cadmium efflux system outer membrane protein
VLAAATGGCRHVPPNPLSAEQTMRELETRSLDDAGLREFLTTHLEPPPAHWPLVHWGLPELTLAALYFQPSLTISRTAADVSSAQIGTAKQRPNPTLTFFPQWVSNAAAAASPWLATAQLNWPIETAGKRGHRMRAAEARAEAADLAVWTEGWRIRAATYAAVVTLAAAEARLRTLEDVRAAQAELVRLFETRLGAGAVAQSDLELQRVALVQATADAASASRLRLEARAGLAGVLGVPPAAVGQLDVVFPLATMPDGLETLTSADARRAALLDRSDVRALLREYAAAESDVRLELARQYPDIEIGSGYEYDQGLNKWGLGVGVTLPVMNQNQGPIDEAVARRAQTAARFEALQASVIAEVGSASARLDGARTEWRQGTRLVTEATRQRDLVAAALARGAADRVGLVGATQQLLRARLVLIAAQEQVHAAVAALEQAVQPARPFTAVISLTPAGAEEGP